MIQNRPENVTAVKAIHDARYAAMVLNLRSRRIRMGMTQQQAASKIGMSRHWLSKIERLEVRLDIFYFVRFCQVCCVRPERMLRYLTGEKPPPRRGFFFTSHARWILDLDFRSTIVTRNGVGDPSGQDSTPYRLREAERTDCVRHGYKRRHE